MDNPMAVLRAGGRAEVDRRPRATAETRLGRLGKPREYKAPERVEKAQRRRRAVDGLVWGRVATRGREPVVDVRSVSEGLRPERGR